MRNSVSVQQHSNVSESLNSMSSFGKTTTSNLLVPEDIHGRVVLYDVFISHRGSDAKKHAATFHDKFGKLGVKSFFDTEGIFKGENLSAIIVEAISSSTVLLVILSKGFAESPWCLEELRLMLERIKEEKNRVFLVPVFFGVQPKDLRDVRRRGPFFKAFQEHEEGKEFSSWAIKKWEEALKEVANIPGSKLSDFKGKKDNLIKTVVQNVVQIVQDVDLEIAKFPVSVDEKVQELNNVIVNAKSLQDSPCVLGIFGMPGTGKTTVAKQYFNTFRSHFKSACFIDGVNVKVKTTGLQDSPCVLAIFGMPGIGKTTVAKQYFNTVRSHFKSACFIDGVSDKVKTTGLASIQKMILKGLVLHDYDIHDVNKGVKLLKKRLQGRKVLLVLDDIDDTSQLEALMVQEVLNPGSVILVTTTDAGLLLNEIQNILYYEMKKLDRCESKELFLLHATQNRELIYPELDTITEEYLDLCDGLPLSLEVIGRSLNGATNKFIWKHSLAKVSDILPSEIKRKFQSYFENMDQVEKDILVDVACFFDGEDYDLAVCFWDATGITGEKVIDNLLLKHAISIDEKNLSIHPQLKRYIIEAVDENNRQYPNHKTHLWQQREVQKALRQIPELVNLEYLSLVVIKDSKCSSLPDVNGLPRSKITWKEYDNDVLGLWPTDCFSHMSKLKFLTLEDDCVEGELCNLPSGILWLQWLFYPYIYFPDGLPISNLRVLELDEGELLALWETKLHAEIPLQLRHLRLQRCQNLESLPTSIGMLIHLQSIVLKGCEALTFLPDEICNAQSLNHLDLSDCSGLQYLPSNIGNLKKMQFLDLSGCVKLSSLPNSFSKLIHMISLNLSGCINLKMDPCFRRTMKELIHLDLLGCRFLVPGSEASPDTVQDFDLINDVLKLTNLQVLKLSFRDYANLPYGFEQLSSLMMLQIQGPGWVDLPCTVSDLVALVTLCLLLQSIGKLKTLRTLKISSCGMVELPEEIGELCNLEDIYIHYCKNLTTLPSTFSNLSMLLKFELVGNSRLSVSHESFSNMSLLRELVIDGCQISDVSLSMMSKYCQSLTYLKLKGLPISGFKIMEDELPNLVSLSIVSCNSLVAIEVFSNLRVLNVASCLHLQFVVVPRGIPMWLRELTLNHCPELSVVQSIDMLQLLEKIDTVGCTNLHYIQDLERVKTLKEMHIFITYWGFTYHGDEWLQKLQRYIYAPAMHFATKTVYNKDELFENFQKMEVITVPCAFQLPENGSQTSQGLTFQLPESTVPCAWVMIAFIYHVASNDSTESLKLYDPLVRGDAESEKYMDFLPQENIYLGLFDDKKLMTTIHKYTSAGVGETIHFSIFTGDFWLCEQLKTGRTIDIISSSLVTLRSGWVRMLSIEEESNIEAIQCEFFECLKKVKEADLSIADDTEEYFYSQLLEHRRGASPSHIEPTESEEEEVREEQVREILDLKLHTRSAADMKDFLALDVANCRIVRGHVLAKIDIQVESFAPTWKKKQVLFNQDDVESLTHLQLEISKACRSLVDSLVVDSHNTYLLVTVKENYDSFPGIINHEFVHSYRSEEQKAADENPTKFLQVLLEHHQDMEYLKQRNEEVQLRENMGRQIQFFADENGPCIWIPDFRSFFQFMKND